MTTIVVAAVAHFGIGLGWPVAFVLGTIVAPTDLIAVTAITDRLPVPRQVLSILEGEGLANDVTALVCYRMAVATVVSGGFSLTDAVLQFLWAAAAGVALGLATGWLAVWVRRRLDDPPVEITISLLTPFAAFLAADSLEASGVLATTAAGLYVGRRRSADFEADARALALSFWRMLEFLLNGLGFILVGLELRGIYRALTDTSFLDLVQQALL